MTEQLSLFTGDPDPKGKPSQRLPAPAPQSPELRALGAAVPAQLFLGTSSWSFPGWAGLVYDTPYDASLLSKSGLAAYSAHPVLRAVSIDRSYYAPVPLDDYAAYAQQVPAGFRFMVKAPADVTTSWMRDDGGKPAGNNPHYLDVDKAIREFVGPAREGLGDRCGPLVFQFPPQGRTVTRQPRTFAVRVGEFLSALPRGGLHAIELRDPELFTDELVGALRASGATLCVSIHPRAIPLAEQIAILRSLPPADLVVRWNLNPRHQYEEAKARYAPFNRMVEPDLATREAIAALCRQSLMAGRSAIVIANNKAEGSAPRTLIALAQDVVSP
jgi:uncharacterized protein YecE (DUF72 family)